MESQQATTMYRTIGLPVWTIGMDYLYDRGEVGRGGEGSEGGQ